MLHKTSQTSLLLGGGKQKNNLFLKTICSFWRLEQEIIIVHRIEFINLILFRFCHYNFFST